MNKNIANMISGLPSSQELDDNEHLMDSEALADTIVDEDVSFYAEL